jgi:hypothetical protein
MAKQLKGQWSQEYDECARYVMPRKPYDINAGRAGSSKSEVEYTFDSTARYGVDTFASDIVYSIFPIGKRWFGLQPKPTLNAEPKVIDAMKRALEVISETIHHYIVASNFDSEVSVAMKDYALGVGCLKVEKGTSETPFRFKAIHMKTLFYDEGAHGTVGNVYREFKLPVRLIEETWPDATVSAELKRQAAEKPDTEVALIEAVYPLEFTTPELNDKGALVSKVVQGWEYVLCLQGGANTGGFVVQRKLRYNPFLIFRWPPNPGEIYSHGPAMMGIEDIKSINKVKQLTLQKASLETIPTFTSNDYALINMRNVKFEPGGVIPVESNGGNRGRSLEPIVMPSGLATSQFVFKDLQASINRGLMTSALGDVNQPVKSATEIATRQMELAKNRGSAFGRIHSELIYPLVDSLLSIAESLNLVDMKGFRVDGRYMAVEYMSPLARAQDVEDAQGAIQYFQTMLGLFGPQMGMAMINVERFVNFVAEKMHVSKDLLPTPEQFEQLKQMAMALVQQQQAQVAPAEGAQAVVEEGAVVA